MGTEVCSVYLADSEDGRLRFMATEGLNRAMVGSSPSPRERASWVWLPCAPNP